MPSVAVRGLGAKTRTAGPVLIQRGTDDFVPKLLDDLRDRELTAVLSSRATQRDSGGTLQLFQPVHRAVHIALFEAVCDRPGQPRLSPREIASAGFVIRRVASARGSGPFGEAWLSQDGTPRGWVKFASQASTKLDPDPERRRLASQGHPEIDARLRQLLRSGDVAEAVVTLHVAPPDVCAAAGRTILFGLVPTASAEMVPPADDATTPYEPDEIARAVPQFLRAGKPPSIDRIALQSFTFETADALANEAIKLGDLEPKSSDSAERAKAKQMYGFLEMLKALSIQLDAFGDSDAAKKLRKKLALVVLDFGGGVTRKADAFLAEAAEALVLSPGSGLSVKLPKTWPALDLGTAGAIRGALGELLQSRFASFVPRATRFDDPEARYRIHGFIRVRRDDGCAPELVWAEPSAPYSILPWYENGLGPPTLVRLPPLDRNNIRKLKPNVAFVVPKNLFCLLNRNPVKELMEGNGKACTPQMLQGGIDWICGFNIPIITICAFIVLFIFLTLFNIIFWWLPFIRICFPLPRGAKELAP
nr:MAG: hypothetical protein DIU78_23595 [Pseudomonadota bacterium]